LLYRTHQAASASHRNSGLNYTIGGIVAAFSAAYKGEADTVIWRVWVGANPPDDCRAIGVGEELP